MHCATIKRKRPQSWHVILSLIPASALSCRVPSLLSLSRLHFFLSPHAHSLLSLLCPSKTLLNPECCHPSISGYQVHSSWQNWDTDISKRKFCVITVISRLFILISSFSHPVASWYRWDAQSYFADFISACRRHFIRIKTLGRHADCELPYPQTNVH